MHTQPVHVGGKGSTAVICILRLVYQLSSNASTLLSENPLPARSSPRTASSPPRAQGGEAAGLVSSASSEPKHDPPEASEPEADSMKACCRWPSPPLRARNVHPLAHPWRMPLLAVAKVESASNLVRIAPSPRIYLFVAQPLRFRPPLGKPWWLGWEAVRERDASEEEGVVGQEKRAGALE
jgi:hypothetical protein